MTNRDSALLIITGFATALATFVISPPALADRIECTLTENDEANGKNACTATYAGNVKDPFDSSLSEDSKKSDFLKIFNAGNQFKVQIQSDSVEPSTEPTEDPVSTTVDLGGGVTATFKFISDPGNGLAAGDSDQIVQVQQLNNPLLALVSEEVSSIPEPSSLSVLLVGMVGLMFAGLRIRKSLY
jgi:hypothetical protein